MSALPDLITTPFRWLAALRHARVFHPDGLLCGGTAALSADHPLPFHSGPVSVPPRISLPRCLILSAHEPAGIADASATGEPLMIAS